MPGMMDTVLNLGLTDASLPRLSEAYGARFANDCMRRLLQMFGDVVLGIPHHLFETRLSDMKMVRGGGVHWWVGCLLRPRWSACLMMIARGRTPPIHIQSRRLFCFACPVPSSALAGLARRATCTTTWS